MEHIKVKGIIFDYGGTIDSRGDHWSEIIWDGYLNSGVQISKDDFRDAYVHAERELAKVRHILPHHNFFDLLLIKMQIELQYLVKDGKISNEVAMKMAEPIAKYCYDQAKSSISDAVPVLENLKQRFPMVLVSNFYGNVESVLEDFGLRKYFDAVIESAVVGVRKPDPKIFALGVEALNLPADQVLVIGDSYKKDILPAESLGCKVLWIKGKGWTCEEDKIKHPNIIKNLSEIVDVVL